MPFFSGRGAPFLAAVIGCKCACDALCAPLHWKLLQNILRCAWVPAPLATCLPACDLMPAATRPPSTPLTLALEAELGSLRRSTSYCELAPLPCPPTDPSITDRYLGSYVVLFCPVLGSVYLPLLGNCWQVVQWQFCASERDGEAANSLYR